MKKKMAILGGAILLALLVLFTACNDDGFGKSDTAAVDDNAEMTATVTFADGRYPSLTCRVGSTITLPQSTAGHGDQILTGFALEENGAIVYVPGGVVTINSKALTLFPVYTSDVVTVDFFGADVEAMTANRGDTLVLPKLIDTASELFLGWGTVHGSTNAEYAPGAPFYVTQSVTLYPVYRQKLIALDFLSENGAVVTSLKLEKGTTAALDEIDLAAFEKTGHTLVGFSDGTKTYALTESIAVSESMSLSPVYQASTYPLRFIDENTEELLLEMSARYGERFRLPSTEEFPAVAGREVASYRTFDGERFRPESFWTCEGDTTFLVEYVFQTTFVRASTGAPIKITGPALTELKFEGLDVEALYTAGFSKYRISVMLELEKTKGKNMRACAVFFDEAEVNKNIVDIIMKDTGEFFKKKNSALYIDQPAYGTSQSSSPWRTIEELLMNNGQFFFYVTVGKSHAFDFANNSYIIKSVTITISFS